MQFGFRTKRTIYQTIMSINTTIDHAHQARVGLAILDTDCKTAFDCCIQEITHVGLLSKEMPDNIVKFLHNHLRKTKFNVIAGGFTSENRYVEDPPVSEVDKEEEHLAFTGS